LGCCLRGVRGGSRESSSEVGAFESLGACRGLRENSTQFGGGEGGVDIRRRRGRKVEMRREGLVAALWTLLI